MVTKIKSDSPFGATLLKIQLSGMGIKTIETYSDNVVAIDNSDYPRARKAITNLKSPRSERFEISSY